MNILYINHENSLGGGSKSLLGIIDELNQYKDVKIFVCIPNIGNGYLEKDLKYRNINYIKLNYKWWMNSNKDSFFKTFIKRIQFIYYNKNAIRLLVSYCKEKNIDIIHSNSMVINIGADVAKITGINHIWHIREFGDDDHGLKFIRNRESSLKFINENSNKIIAISKSIMKKFEGNFDCKKLKLIYNGVENNYIINRISDKNNFSILLAGAIKKSKGQKQAILAVEQLIKKGYNIKLILAGNIEDCYGENLKDYVKKNKIDKNIEFLGFTNELNKIRKNIDIELVCSKKEAFGRVTVEAMMSGNAVIGSNTGATKELIIDGYNGVLYKEGNIEDLKNKIEYLILNEDKRKKMGVNGREFVLENFTADINAKNIYKVYKELLS
ncbi:TPA: glycosyltransferase family 4 protein [Clostridium perfringens]|uniref:glycosyltransferase family 4 protein n=1 Tax=Clostridium perfringens TaxID=1502 RepID=UPI001A2EC439|nr:glycosyltransferase family 4 protein [Clostridium perfringens]UBK66657.1 glycosyltransferase family 4 protein [Clostridium perfringens]HAT4202275.1 glycosyltransferase family 4 protein [Clostridium perfringens]